MISIRSKNRPYGLLKRGKELYSPVHRNRVSRYTQEAGRLWQPYSVYTEDEDIPTARKNDLLVLWDGARAGICGTNLEGAISSTIVKVSGDSTIHETFLYWYYKGFEWYMLQCVVGTTIPHMSKEYIEQIGIINWSSIEQHRIADYLDTKCAQIDRAIARQQEVIEKLKEYKLSVITEAVTKGLNPDVPMKDSGIEWIGEIPEHWDVSALKNYIDVLPGYAFSSLDFDTENGIPLLRGVNVTPSGLRWDDVVYWNKSITSELEPFMLCKNDIVFGLDRPWINEGTRITIISENDLPCLLLQRVCRIRSTGGLDFTNIYYWLGSSMFQDIVSLATTGVSVPHISTRQIGKPSCK